MAGSAGAGAGPGAGISPMSGPGEAGAGPAANEAGSAALQFGTLAAKTATLVGSSSPGSQHGKSVGFCPVLLIGLHSVPQSCCGGLESCCLRKMPMK